MYDVQDTDGSALPEDVNCFVARGHVDAAMFSGSAKKLGAKNI
jgi:hypothetical protein